MIASLSGRVTPTCVGKARDRAAHLAHRLHAAPSREIAARLGYRNISSASAACRRVQAATEKRRFAKALTQLRESLSQQ